MNVIGRVPTSSTGPCRCLKGHSPAPLLFKGLTMPAGSVTWLCPTGFENVSQMVQAMRRAGAVLSSAQLRAAFGQSLNAYQVNLARTYFQAYP